MSREEVNKVERPLVRGIESIGGMVPKFTSPGRKGAPDRIVILIGRVIFVETKTPAGRLDPMQVVWKEDLEAAGAEYRCLTSREEVNAFVKEMRLYAEQKVLGPDAPPTVRP